MPMITPIRHRARAAGVPRDALVTAPDPDRSLGWSADSTTGCCGRRVRARRCRRQQFSARRHRSGSGSWRGRRRSRLVRQAHAVPDLVVDSMTDRAHPGAVVHAPERARRRPHVRTASGSAPESNARFAEVMAAAWLVPFACSTLTPVSSSCGMSTRCGESDLRAVVDAGQIGMAPFFGPPFVADTASAPGQSEGAPTAAIPSYQRPRRR